MDHPSVDLSYLERFCNGDRMRMQKYISIYLETSPALFEQLAVKSAAGDAEALAETAHSLRPQIIYMGARSILDLLAAIEQRARSEGSEACADLLQELFSLSERVNTELRAALAVRPT